MNCPGSKPDDDWPVLRSLGEGGTMRYFVEKNPELKLHELPLEQARPDVTS